MLKRFVWNEGDLHSIQLRDDLYLVAQLLENPYAAFFAVTSPDNFNSEMPPVDLNDETPLLVTMILKRFVKSCSVGRVTNPAFTSSAKVPLPVHFISKCAGSFSDPDHDVHFNVVRIDPRVGDKGRLGNPVVERDVGNDSPHYERCELTGYNTGYELIRRLLLSLEHGRAIDPLKEVWFNGKDPYPYPTVQDMWDMGVPRYEQ